MPKFAVKLRVVGTVIICVDADNQDEAEKLALEKEKIQLDEIDELEIQEIRRMSR